MGQKHGAKAEPWEMWGPTLAYFIHNHSDMILPNHVMITTMEGPTITIHIFIIDKIHTNYKMMTAWFVRM